MEILGIDTIRRLANTASTLAELVAQAVLNCGACGEIAINFDSISVTTGNGCLSFDDYPIRKVREQQKNHHQHLEELKSLLVEVTPMGHQYQIVSDNTILFDVDSTTELSLFRSVYGDFESTPIEVSYKDTVVSGWLWDQEKRFLFVNDRVCEPPTKYRFNYVLFCRGGDDYKMLLDQVFGLMSPARHPLSRSSPRKRSQSPRLLPPKKSRSPGLMPPKTISKSELASFRVINQVEHRFIMLRTKHSGEVVMVDQHAADERVRLEKILETINLESVSIDKVVDIPFSERLAANLAHFGFEIDASIDDKTKVLAVPQLLQGITDDQLESALKEQLRALQSRDKPWLLQSTTQFSSYPEVVLQTAYSVACKSAIKFGDKLTCEEMDRMVSALSKCVDPFHCAHGRPTIVTLDGSLMRKRPLIDEEFYQDKSGTNIC